VFEVDWLGLRTREELRERTAALIAEACAWAVGLSDRPHHRLRAGRLVATGATVGERAAAGLPLADDEGAVPELADARPGSFRDALAASGADGIAFAVRFDDEVLVPFVHDICVRAAERARAEHAAAWVELAEDLGEDPSDAAAVVRAGDWASPLRIDAELLVLAALGDVPLLQVEAEGLPLSLVRAAEAVTRDAASPGATPGHTDEDPGALFLAETALAGSGLDVPVQPQDAARLLDVLRAHDLADDELPGVLARLPLAPGTVELVTALAARGDG
jgi:hypothetical protein